MLSDVRNKPIDAATAPLTVKPAGRTASGIIKDARPQRTKVAEPPADVPVTVPKDSAATTAKAVSKAVEQKTAAIPKPALVEEPPKKRMSRPKMVTMIAGGSVAFLLAVGVAIHFIRRYREKLAAGPLKVWQSWRRKPQDDEVPHGERFEPVADQDMQEAPKLAVNQ
jgi:pilus assembly protein FimV